MSIGNLAENRFVAKLAASTEVICDFEQYLNSIFAHKLLDMAWRERFCG